MATETTEATLDELGRAASLTGDDEVECIKEFLKVRLELDELTERSRPLITRKESLQDRITELLGARGIRSVDVDGYRFTPSRKLYPRVLPEHKAEAIAALETMGLGERCVTIQPQAIQSLLREWVADGSMPEAFKPFCDLTFEKVSLRVTKLQRGGD